MNSVSTPADVVIEYFDSLRWLADSAEDAGDEQVARRFAAMATIMAVTAVDVFFNLWFRALVEDRDDQALRADLIRDLEARVSLDQKLGEWTKRHLPAMLDLKQGPGRAFVELKELRNGIIHFTSTHETIHTPGMIVHGMANTSSYDSLSAKSARDAVSVAEALIEEILRLAGFDEEMISTALAAWIGKRIVKGAGLNYSEVGNLCDTAPPPSHSTAATNMSSNLPTTE